MRFPVGRSGNTLDPLWYIATQFGHSEPYGFHEGLDLNLRTGADSDLGQPLYAVANGIIRYYHNASHPNSGFGRHMVLECETIRGKRWYHYAHAQEIITEVISVKEGDVIGKLGKSGTQTAHLHFSCFKVDPITTYGGIDSLASNLTNLNNWWEKFELLATSEPLVYTESQMTIVRLERDKWFNLLKEVEKKISDATRN